MSSTDTQAVANEARSVTVTADFGRAVDYPLSKTKFAVYNSGLVTLDRYKRDVERFVEVSPESLRIDIAWGWGPDWNPYTVQPITGSPANLTYNFDELDELATLLNGVDVRPYWSYCYMPVPLQQNGDWRSAPVSMDGWERVLAAFARHYRERGIRIGYHEVYNEPDLIDSLSGPVFFSGTRDAYFEMYRRGALAIKGADPDAVVGGPALAFINEDSWTVPFLEHVTTHDLPLDFFSFHHYGQGIEAKLAIVRAGLDRDPRFATTEMHLNEYNSLVVDYPLGGPQERHAAAAMLLQDVHLLLAHPEVTKVNWAQFLDSGHDNYSGMVSIDGQRKAVFNAYKIYMRMPADRRQVTIAGPEGLGGMASTDGRRTSLIVWNRTESDQALTIDLSNVPFAAGTLRVYRIDAEHGSWGDDPGSDDVGPVETRAGVATAALSWSGPIPCDGVVYLEVSDGTDAPTAASVPCATVLRTLHYYPDRALTCYADFDPKTWTAWLGMASEERGVAIIGATVEHLPDTLDVSFEVDDVLRRDEDSLCGLRIDYMVDGVYAKAVLVHGPDNGVDGPARSAQMPWGTGRQADQVMGISDLAHIRLEVSAYAPAGWGGRAQITFMMQSAEPGRRAKVLVREG